MTRIVFVYGAIAGAIIIAFLTISVALGADTGRSSEWAGYLIMLAGLSLIFIGVKRYRDTEQGGVIRFVPAQGMGLGIALVASAIYFAG